MILIKSKCIINLEFIIKLTHWNLTSKLLILKSFPNENLQTLKSTLFLHLNILLFWQDFMYYQSRTYLKSFKNTLFILVQVSVFWIESSLKSNLYPKENQGGQSYSDLFELPFPWSHFWVWGHPGCTLWTEKKNQTCKKFNLGLPQFNKKKLC